MSTTRARRLTVASSARCRCSYRFSVIAVKDSFYVVPIGVEDECGVVPGVIVRSQPGPSVVDPEGFQNTGSCCGAVVFVDESPELVATLDCSAGRLPGCDRRFGREERECSMGPLAVVVLGVDA